MRTIINRLLAATLALTPIVLAAPAAAQCPAVAALPDTERRTTYSVSAETGPFNVGFAVYGDGTDYGQWVEVWVDGEKLTAVTDWTLSLSSGTLATACRPLTNARITFVAAQTGTVEIVGARRPRRTTQFTEGVGVTARQLNQAFSDVIAQNRETWDLRSRMFLAPAGETGATLSGPLTGVISGPSSVTDGNLAVWDGTSGAALRDGGRPTGINVKSHGAVGDGTTDDRDAVQSAVTEACGTVGVGGSGAEVFVPAGFYRLSAGVTADCGVSIRGEGWSGDSGALLQATYISSTAGLSGSIFLPASGIDAFTFTTNQAVKMSGVAVLYLTQPAAGSGRIAIKIQAAGAATSPAVLPWNEDTVLDNIWVYGADINLAMVNAGHWRVTNSHFVAHHTNGILIQANNIPYAGSWRVGPNNVFESGSSTACQHLLATSSGGGHIHGNTFWSCGSNNVIPPLETSAIALIPTLNAVGHQFEPVTISGNTMEGLSNCILIDGSFPGQNASLTQFSIVGNQLWCLRNIDIRATSGGTAWVSGGTITGNYMNSATIAGGVLTATENIKIAGASNIAIAGNTFGLFQANGGGDTSTPISLGTAASEICVTGNKVITSTGVSAVATSIPFCAPTIQVPTVIGGTGTTGTQLTLQSTTGIGTTDAVAVKGGNNGATTFGTFNATKLDVPQTTASTSSTTGALTVAGGLGVALTANVGTSLTTPLNIGGTGVGSDLTLQSTSGVGDGTDNVIVKVGNNGATTAGTFSNTKLDLPQTTVSTSATTGALTVSGGIGAAGSISAANTNNANSPALNISGSITNTGNVGVLSLTSTSTHSTGGAALYYGGLLSPVFTQSGGTASFFHGTFNQASAIVTGGNTMARSAALATSSVAAGASPTGTITDMIGFLISSPSSQASGSPTVTITRTKGVDIADQGGLSAVSGFTTSTTYGVHIAAQTNSDGTAYSIFTAGAGLVEINDTTDATSSSTGSVTTSGGLSAEKSIWAGTFVNVGTKVRAAGSAPALSSCGTSPAIAGSDLAGTVTMGTGGPTGCVITFNAAYAAAPHCVVSWQANLASMQYTVSTSAITLVQTSTSSNLVNYICMARSGG